MNKNLIYAGIAAFLTVGACEYATRPVEVRARVESVQQEETGFVDVPHAYVIRAENDPRRFVSLDKISGSIEKGDTVDMVVQRSFFSSDYRICSIAERDANAPIR